MKRFHILAIAGLAITLAAMLTYRFAGDALAGQPLLVSATTTGPSTQTWLAQLTYKDVMMAIVTILVLVASLYMLVSNRFSDNSQKLAAGLIGSILGFWLKV